MRPAADAATAFVSDTARLLKPRTGWIPTQIDHPLARQVIDHARGVAVALEINGDVAILRDRMTPWPLLRAGQRTANGPKEPTA